MITPCVFGEGLRTTSMALVGEAPGFNEAKLRRPFIGRAGELLTKLLHSSNIPRSDVYITNVIKQRPGKDDNDLSDWFVNRGGRISVSEGYKEYVEMLRKELLQLPNLKVVVPLGNAALYALCNEVAITKRRGSILESTLIPGLKCIPTIHPASALREYKMELFIKFDLSRAKEESLTKEIVLPEREIIIEPSYDQIVGFLIECNNSPEVAFDIEVMNEEISCMSFSLSPSKGISIPFVYNGNSYLTPTQEAMVWKLSNRILSNPAIRKIGQNFIFDMSFVFRKYGIIVNNYDCTMIAQGLSYPDFPKGLDFITSIYTREPYYKDDGKKWFKTGGSYHNFWIYNAKDSLVCQEAFPKIMDVIHSQGNYETYKSQRDLIHPLMYMQARGMRVDIDSLKEASKQAEEKITERVLDLAKLQECEVGFKVEKDPDMYKVTNRSDGTCIIIPKNEFTRMCKHTDILNIGSSQQLANLFYTKLGNKPYLDKGSVTTNDDALKRLVRKGIKEALIIRDVRKIAKLKGTYYDMKMSADGRLRSAMNPIGTVSGRLASSQDIFGEGGNVQNLPLVFQQYVLADEGYVMYIPDLSQAENRTTANIAPEPLMLKAFAEDVDIHSLTASMISGIDMNEIKRQDKEGINCNLGTGEYTWRFWGKKSNHSLNYDLGYKSFALRFEMPESQAKMLVDRFHKIYPGIRQYHAWVRALLQQNRTLVNCFGRVRVFMDRWGDDLFKEAYSWIPQSSIADKMNRQGINYIYYNQDLFREIELLNQIHDSLVFQIPVAIGWKRHAEMLLLIKKSLETPMVWHGKEFTIPLEFKFGHNMRDTKKVGIDDNETIERLADKLHGVYDQLGAPRQLPNVDRDICDSSIIAEEMQP